MGKWNINETKTAVKLKQGGLQDKEIATRLGENIYRVKHLFSRLKIASKYKKRPRNCRMVHILDYYHTRSINELSHKTGIPYSALGNWSRGFTRHTLKFSGGAGLTYKKGGYFGHGGYGQCKPIRKPTEQDAPLLSEFIGVVLGDGQLSKGSVIISLDARNEIGYAKVVKHMIKKMFNLSSTGKKRRGKKVYNVRIYSTNLVSYLVSRGLKVGNKKVNKVVIPAWVAHNRKNASRCIRGLVDTDGTVEVHGPKKYAKPQISYSSAIPPLFDSVCQILHKDFNFSKSKKKGGVLVLYISGKEDVKKYKQQIGFSNPYRKKQVLESQIKARKWVSFGNKLQ